MHYQEKAVQYFFVRSGRSLLQKGNEKKNVGGCSIFHANANIWVYFRKFDFVADFRELENGQIFKM